MISIIVAMSENRVIGKDNGLPWRLSEDLKRFRILTMGHPVIMGRKTFESIGKPLPGRTNIVITRNREWHSTDVLVCSSIEEALQLANRQPGSQEIFICGGGEIYQQALSRTQRIYLTLVEQVVEGDVYFPVLEADGFKEISREVLQAQSGVPAYSFITLEKRALKSPVTLV